MATRLNNRSGKPRGHLSHSIWPPGYTTEAESQEDISFPADGHQSIQQKRKAKRTSLSQYMATRVYNRSGKPRGHLSHSIWPPGYTTEAESQEDISFTVYGHQAIQQKRKTKRTSLSQYMATRLYNRSGKPRGHLSHSIWPPGYTTEAESQEDISFTVYGHQSIQQKRKAKRTSLSQYMATRLYNRSGKPRGHLFHSIKPPVYTTEAESQEDISFPVYGHQAIQQKWKAKRTSLSQYMATRLHNRSGKPRGHLFPSSWPPGYTTEAESQEDISFPVYGHQAIQQKRKAKRTSLSQYMATSLYNRSGKPRGHLFPVYGHQAIQQKRKAKRTSLSQYMATSLYNRSGKPR